MKLVWRFHWLGLAWALALSSGSRLSAGEIGDDGRPKITAIQSRGGRLVIRAAVPAGVARVVLEGSSRSDFRGWIPRAVQRTTGTAAEVEFEVSAAGGVEVYRVRADATDPLPAAYYAGATNFPGDALAGDPATRNLALPGAVDVTTGGNGGESASRTVVESDIWAVRGDTLYFFNQYRGLQVLDLVQPDAPSLKGTFALPGAGEQMYVLDERHVVLLARDTCHGWGTEAASAVVIVDTGAAVPIEVARLPVRGTIAESRLVGTALYVASETWEPVGDASGAWQNGTHVASFDLANPAVPVVRKPLWFAGSGNVVTATDRFLFVAVIDYSQAWPWRSELQVIDIASPDGTMAAFARVSLAGRVPDKFKIDLAGDVLRVVTEAAESTSGVRFVTVLETIRLADPRSAAPVAYARLDRLELARGERLFATRFDGNRAYVVTFQRVDPLWIVDLSDPADVKVAGELEIPGWSTFIRPLGDRLLTLGVDDARGSRVALQLFDVSNPAKPTLLAKVPLGENASWTEANSDEKALGIFPEDGLLLVPVSEWSGVAASQGVQLVDLGRDTLKKRGWLASGDVVARRAALHRDRVLALSGRRLQVADVVDRDQPKVSASLELSFPVERVVVAGDHLIEFQGGAVRVQSTKALGTAPTVLDLGELPVLGAAVKGSRLHVLQGKAAEVQWNFVEARNEWVATTNAGTVVASVWNASALPRLERVGDPAKAPTTLTWLPDVEALWLSDALLVWATQSQGYSPWLWAVRGGAAVDAIGIMPGGRFWWPWWGNSPRTLWAVALDAEARPSLASELQVSTEASAVGQSMSSGPLVLGTRQKFESEVTGTNWVVEKAWFPTGVGRVTNVVDAGGGTAKTNVAEATEGEWRTVTNGYPVVRWWSRYVLDVVDYSADPRAPILRPALAIGGRLVGVSHGGAVLYTTSTPVDEKGNQVTWLEAAAYDGVALHRIDGIAIADGGASETALVAFRDGDGYVARGGWGTNAVQRLEAWRLTESGRWEKRATVPLAAVPTELERFGDVVVALGSGLVDLVGIAGPTPLVPLPSIGEMGCVGGTLSRGDGDAARGIWLPQYDYGVVRLGP